MKVKLTKTEIAEGLTSDMLLQFNEHKAYSPVQLQAGDEPAHLLKCSTGYWIKDPDGGYLRDTTGALIVVSERECRIGRARYLLNFGDQEKQQKVYRLIESWKAEVRQKLDVVKCNVEKLENRLAPSSNSIEDALEKLIQAERPGALERQRKEDEQSLSTLKPQYLEAEDLYLDGKIIELMEMLGIRTFNNPMFSAQKDNDAQMLVLKNTFGRQALDNWNGDMLTMYARLEIEKQVTGL